MAKKYIKNENGIVKAIRTETLQLEKPLASDFYDINVFNGNMDKIDKALKNISTDAKGTSFDNSDNGMTATNVQDAIEENKTSIQSANRNISSLESSVSALQSELGTNKTTLQNNINAIREVL